MHSANLLINLLGFAATAFSIFMWIPQARTTWRNRNDAARLAGVSETTQWMLMIGYLLWGLYGVLTGSFWVAAPSVVAFPLALATVVVVHRGRRLPPPTRSVPIIDTATGPLSVVNTADSTSIVSTSIVSTEESVDVGATLSTDAYTATGTIPVLT